MVTEAERRFFDEQGYLHVPGVLNPEHLARLRAAFDTASVAGGRQRVWQETLLGIPEFLELLEHPPLTDRLRAIFGDQLQLLSYDILYQGPNSRSPERAWHRDFVFPGDRPLAVNSIIYLDNMTDERGPTFVVPGTHRGTELPPKERRREPLPGEVGCMLAPGTLSSSTRPSGTAAHATAPPASAGPSTPTSATGGSSATTSTLRSHRERWTAPAWSSGDYWASSR
jgi:hypothetical protein